MTDPKERFYRARRRAMRVLVQAGARVVILNEDVFDIEATDEDTIRKIKICVDCVGNNAIDAVASVPLPPVCRRQIWLKRGNNANFEIIKIKACQ